MIYGVYRSTAIAIHVVILFIAVNQGGYAFISRSYRRMSPLSERTSDFVFQSSKLPFDDNTAKQIDRAKQLLQEAKKKLASSPPVSHDDNNGKNNDKGEENQKEFNEIISKSNRKDKVIKTRNQETGLFTTDGELMAALSAEEEWEIKALMDVFDSEVEEESDVSKHIANRDVVSSIRNLKRELKNEDYDKIFDKKNRFIGEDY